MQLIKFLFALSALIFLMAVQPIYTLLSEVANGEAHQTTTVSVLFCGFGAIVPEFACCTDLVKPVFKILMNGKQINSV